jgi:hypothetical protein
VGQHSFQASYSGDSSYSGSKTNTASTLVVAPATTNVTVSSNATTALVGEKVTLTATVTTPTSSVGSVGEAPTGTVTFYANGQPTTKPSQGSQASLGEAENVASLTAILVYTAASTATITASYSGDSNYLPSNSATSSSTASAVLTVVPYLITAQHTSSSSPIIIPAAGQQGFAPLTVQLGTDITSLNLGCSVGPTPAADSPTCSFSGDPVTRSGTVYLLLNTTAPSTASRLYLPPGLLKSPMAGVVILVIAVSVISYRRRRSVWVLVLLMLLASLCAVCGTTSTPTSSANNTSQPGTPAGVYTVTAYGLQSGPPPVTVYFQVE